MVGVGPQTEIRNDQETTGARSRGFPVGVVRGSHSDVTARYSKLMQTIEGEVIPRVLLAQRSIGLPSRPPSDIAPSYAPQDVAEFVARLLAADSAAATAFIEEQRERGAAIETLYIDLLAPAARRLGVLWEEDLCDFTQVTTGLGRLHHLLHLLGDGFGHDHESRAPGRKLLLMPAPGDQHTFGITMVAEFFRRAGWNVRSGPKTSQQDLVAIVRAEWFSVVGISVGSETRLEALTATIRVLRRASRNKSIGVMVGGPLLVAHPEIAGLVGADATAVDGRQAVIQAQSLLVLLNRSP